MGKSICLDLCDKTCCKDILIPITHLDVIRIVKHTKCDPLDFIQFYYFDEDISKLTRFTTAYIGDQVFVLSLKLNTHTEICVFNKNRKCTIYKYRPFVCRVYPFDITENGFIKFKNAKCPMKWDDSQLMQARKYRLQAWEEEKIYDKRIIWWNTYARHLTLRAFYDYLFDDLPIPNSKLSTEEKTEMFMNINQASLFDQIPRPKAQRIIEIEGSLRVRKRWLNKLKKKKITQLKSYYNKYDQE